MTDTPVIDLLSRLMQENWRHARLSENRRIAVTSVNLAAATGILIALRWATVDVHDLALALALVILGTYGTAACVKLHERALFHEHRARLFRDRLVELLPQSDAGAVNTHAYETHGLRHRYVARLRFNSVLLLPNVSIAAAGGGHILFVLSPLPG